MNWNYKEEKNFDEIPVGAYRCKIVEADLMQSQTGRDMIRLNLQISGFNTRIYHYIVFLNDRPEITNRNLTQLFDSFEFMDTQFNVSTWVGKTGACQIKHDEEGRAKIQYFISKIKKNQLPEWKEVASKDDGMPNIKPIVDVDADKLPF